MGGLKRPTSKIGEKLPKPWRKLAEKNRKINQWKPLVEENKKIIDVLDLLARVCWGSTGKMLVEKPFWPGCRLSTEKLEKDENPKTAADSRSHMIEKEFFCYASRKGQKQDKNWKFGYF